MGLILVCITSVLVALAPSISDAGWTGPTELSRVMFGSATTEVGITIGDTLAYDHLPALLGSHDNVVFIQDSEGSGDVKVFGLGTSNLLYEATVGTVPIGASTMAFFRGTPGQTFSIGVTDLSTHSILWQKQDGPIPSVCPDVDVSEMATPSYIWFCPHLFDTSGTLITTTTERPLELGRVTMKQSGTTFEYTIEYPDRIFVYDSDKQFNFDPVRIGQDVIMAKGIVRRYTVTQQIPTAAGQKPKYRLAGSDYIAWPKDTHECVPDPYDITTGVRCTRHASFGNPIIGPDGSVYTYKAVYPGNAGAGYYILKWSWVP